MNYRERLDLEIRVNALRDYIKSQCTDKEIETAVDYAKQFHRLVKSDDSIVRMLSAVIFFGTMLQQHNMHAEKIHGIPTLRRKNPVPEKEEK